MYPDITKQMIDGIRKMCLKNFTEKSMEEEAKKKEKQRLMQLGQKKSSMNLDGQEKGNQPEEKK